MTARGGPLPHGEGWAYEVKRDGFRALVSTVDGLHVRSRRGWPMGDLVPELATLSPDLVLDGELVAWGGTGCRPSRDGATGSSTAAQGSGSPTSSSTCSRSKAPRPCGQPFRERRAILDSVELDLPALVGDVFDNGEALFEVVCDRGMEGVVAKRWSSHYRPGHCGWVKVKNPSYWRLGDERELARRRRRRLTV